jgi:hypothetical protein
VKMSAAHRVSSSLSCAEIDSGRGDIHRAKIGDSPEEPLTPVFTEVCWLCASVQDDLPAFWRCDTCDGIMLCRHHGSIHAESSRTRGHRLARIHPLTCETPQPSEKPIPAGGPAIQAVSGKHDVGPETDTRDVVVDGLCAEFGLGRHQVIDVDNITFDSELGRGSFAVARKAVINGVFVCAKVGSSFRYCLMDLKSTVRDYF